MTDKYVGSYTIISSLNSTEQLFGTKGGVQVNIPVTLLATAAQLSAKVDKDGAKVLSDNNFTNAYRDKLTGISAGATVNSSDMTLLSRANHTGTQDMSTVTGLEAALTGKASAAALTNHLAGVNPHGITKSLIGLANADNTADTAKPVSLLMQAALDLKLDIADFELINAGDFTGVTPQENQILVWSYTADKFLLRSDRLIYGEIGNIVSVQPNKSGVGPAPISYSDSSRYGLSLDGMANGHGNGLGLSVGFGCVVTEHGGLAAGAMSTAGVYFEHFIFNVTGEDPGSGWIYTGVNRDGDFTGYFSTSNPVIVRIVPKETPSLAKMSIISVEFDPESGKTTLVCSYDSDDLDILGCYANTDDFSASSLTVGPVALGIYCEATRSGSMASGVFTSSDHVGAAIFGYGGHTQYNGEFSITGGARDKLTTLMIKGESSGKNKAYLKPVDPAHSFGGAEYQHIKLLGSDGVFMFKADIIAKGTGGRCLYGRITSVITVVDDIVTVNYDSGLDTVHADPGMEYCDVHVRKGDGREICISVTGLEGEDVLWSGVLNIFEFGYGFPVAE